MVKLVLKVVKQVGDTWCGTGSWSDRVVKQVGNLRWGILVLRVVKN